MRTDIVLFSVIIYACKLHLCQFTQAEIENVKCFQPNFGCHELSNYRCGCYWQNDDINRRDLKEDKCIPFHRTCDAFMDCADGSDEFNCSCPEGNYKCGCDVKDPNCKKGRGCIKLEQVCDGKDDCSDRSDETNCSCRKGEYKCGCPNRELSCDSHNYTKGCISVDLICDGCSHCPDGNDEIDCTCKVASQFQCGCNQTITQCENGKNCISGRLVCNGRKDCKDGSDEVGCSSCGSEEFSCDKSFSHCILKAKICNGIADCPGGSDEVECCALPFMCNNSNNFEQYREPTLIDGEWKCDGLNDCGDWSDELNCTYEDFFRCKCHNETPVSCDHDEVAVINRNFVCDSFSDCSDGSDEFCNCTEEQFRCEVSGLCLNMHDVCDGKNNCGDWSEERDCSCPNETFQCSCYTGNITCSKYSKGCISNSSRCDGKDDCKDWSDEEGCDCPESRPNPCDCYINNRTCKESIGCFRDRQRCNGRADCEDYTDEIGCDCKEDEIRCGCIKAGVCRQENYCIERRKINDGQIDCLDRSDELCNITKQQCDKTEYVIYICSSVDNCTYSPNCDNTTCFCSNTTEDMDGNCRYGSWICTSPVSVKAAQCKQVLQCSEKHAILTSNFCDRETDCSEDEDSRKPGFKCATRTLYQNCVLPQRNVYDSVPQCADKSDLCFVNGSFNCFQCFTDGLIISGSQVCDGVVDCLDLSDECLCENQTVCNAILGGNWSTEQKLCPPTQMPCNGTCTDIVLILCNQVVECANATDEKYCDFISSSSNNFELVSCYNRLGTVNVRKCDGIPECGNLEDECISCFPKPDFCNDSCHKFYPIGDRYCNGRSDQAYLYINSSECQKGFDEINCPKRFYCNDSTLLSIDEAQVCNGVMDCPDGSDEYIEEKNCTNRFYCEDTDYGTTFSIHFTKAGDGKKDCDDGSDECPTIYQENAFSSQKEMISSAALRGVVWFIATLAICANLLAIIHIYMQLNRKELSPLSRCNYIILLNLGIADLLMGIYLLIIGIKSLLFSGEYCRYDIKWRTSSQCAALGSLAIISSETSVILLVLLASLRITAVFRPFETRLLYKTKQFAILVAGAWIFSIVIATIPLANNLHSYFASALWFPNTIFNSDVVNRERLTKFAHQLCHLLSDKSEDFSSWDQVVAYIQKRLRLQMLPKAFGYYSDNSVCLPRFYVSHGQAAWEYSMFLITFNFVLFVCIAVGYVVLYKKSKTQLISNLASEQNSILQQKIARLIATDFFCWVPICVLAYVKVSGIHLDPIIYVVSAVVLLPINSALNPLLHTPIFENFLKQISFKSSKILRRGTVGISTLRVRVSRITSSSSASNQTNISRNPNQATTAV